MDEDETREKQRETQGREVGRDKRQRNSQGEQDTEIRRTDMMVFVLRRGEQHEFVR